ncbi:MAG: type II toxin-antitoxin system RelE/ParE family toxin [Tenuifilaceae bacterium]|jgi:plasmid stabilization system protein ParE|nr:type II toxin-antitoxin system RelE/ParE family toxin [Tenuifilaceae bacterium]
MAGHKLIINPFAEQDILDAQDWYNDQTENFGSELVQEIKHTIHSIEVNPLQFPEVKRNIRRAIVNGFPYSVFYTINKSVIIVFALFHHSRNPRIWRKREPQ